MRDPDRGIRTVRTPRGARLVQDDVVLSEVLDRPGATDSVFDLLAACIAALRPGPRTLMLGFAGGGVIAPLRAMGDEHPIESVDLSRAGWKLFRDLSADWAGDVELHDGDAVAWLRRTRRRFDVILEDLSVPSPGGVVKPYESLVEMPLLVRSHLRPGGLAIVNVLPLRGTSWDSLLARIAAPWPRALVVHMEDFENKVVLAGDAAGTARAASRRIRHRLRAIDSSQAEAISVRTLRRPTTYRSGSA